MSGVKKSIGIVVLSHNMPGVGTCQGVIGDYKSLDGGLPEMARRSGSVFAVKLSLACEATPPELAPGPDASIGAGPRAATAVSGSIHVE